MAKIERSKKFEHTYSTLILISVVMSIVELMAIAFLILVEKINLFGLKELLFDNNLFILIFIIVVITLNMAFEIYYVFKFVLSRGHTDLSSADLFGGGVDESYNYGKVGLVVVDKNKDDYIVVWANSFMMNRYGMGNRILINSDIREVFPGINVDAIEDQTIQIDYATYKIKHLMESGLFIFVDQTDYADLRKKYIAEATVIGLIRIDNYQTDARLRGNISLMSDINHSIADYFEKREVMVSSTSEDSFLFTCSQETLNLLIKDQFSILDKVKEINTDSNNFLTISIGVASGISSVLKLKEMSSDALKQALTRGGDQAVVCRFGESTLFIGGKTLAKASQNNANTREIANKLLKFIEESDQIIIMGHNNTDLDAFGSALGLLAMCQYKKKDAKILFEKNLSGSDVRNLVVSKYGINNKMFVNEKEAIKIAENNTNVLLIVTDVSSREMVISTELLDVYQLKIVIIDHHQPGVNMKRIENTIATYIYPQASSASELIANFIRYATANPRIELPADFATVMLSGILLDTDGYRRDSTSPSTYEASMFLKECGADNQNAAKIVEGSKEQFVLLNKYLANMQNMMPGVVYCVVDEGEDTLTEETISKLSDSYMRIRDIKVSFAIGKIVRDRQKALIKISARSDGTVNIGKLMQLIGGGGRFNAAAATLTDVSLKEAERKLVKCVHDHIDECRYVQEDM